MRILALFQFYLPFPLPRNGDWEKASFPTRIRYSSMSLPHHIGNGWFGGFVPTIAFALVSLEGNIYYSLWHPIIVALMTLMIGTLLLRDTEGGPIHD